MARACKAARCRSRHGRSGGALYDARLVVSSTDAEAWRRLTLAESWRRPVRNYWLGPDGLGGQAKARSGGDGLLQVRTGCGANRKRR
jgi:hypothetical protein